MNVWRIWQEDSCDIHLRKHRMSLIIARNHTFSGVWIITGVSAMHRPDGLNEIVTLRMNLQLKFYSRDFLVPGRVRIQLFNPDGKPCNPEIPNSKP